MMKTVQGFFMILIFLSLFVIFPNIQVVKADWSRAVNVNIIATSDSQTSFINNISLVEAGIQQAALDAAANSKVELYRERINVNLITTNLALAGALLSCSPHDVFINAHGQVVPMPNGYFGPYISITSPSDGQTVYTNGLMVWAYFEPPPGSQLQLFNPGVPGDTSMRYAWCRWIYPQTGDSGWAWMWPSYGASGGVCDAALSLADGYGTYDIFVYAVSDSLMTCAHITVYYEYSEEHFGGGCPFISEWNGTQYVTDNNVLRKGDSSVDVLDCYKLEKALVPDCQGTCSLLLSEFEHERDFIDQVRLMAVDHPSDVSVGVSPDGSVLTYSNPHPPVSALDDEHEQVKSLIESLDGKYYQGYNGSYIDLNFGDELNVSQGARLVLRTDVKCADLCIAIQVRAADHGWKTVSAITPRKYWSTDIVDMTHYLPDTEGNLKVRLCFTANHKIDLVGLDTNPQTPLNVTYGKLVSAAEDQTFKVPGRESSGLGATYSNLLSSDGVHAELTPGHSIQLNFTFANGPPADEVRDFVFITNGHYTQAGSPVACKADWQDWFYYLRNAMTFYGVIWANVAGYSFYYFGNSWYDSKVGSMTYGGLYPAEAGLQQVLGENVICSPSDGHTAQKIDSFAISEGGQLNGRGAFDTANGAYTSNGGFPSHMPASRPLINNTLQWDLIGYADESNLNQYVTAAITMSGSGSVPGVLIHSGFSPSQGTLIQGATDDWWKGYIATAMAIEEARAYIMSPITSSTTAGTPNTFAAVFSVTMLAGGWGIGGVTLPGQGTVQCAYVELELNIPNHYQKYTETYQDMCGNPVPPYAMFVSLGVADFQLTSSDPNIYAKVDLTRSGWETGGTSSSFEDNFGWWLVGLGVDTLGLCTSTWYLGSAVGTIPLMQTGPVAASCTSETAALNQGVFADGITIDPNGDNWGTVSMYFKVYFPLPAGGAASATHTMNVNMETWLQATPLFGITNSRWPGSCQPFNTQLQFSVF